MQLQPEQAPAAPTLPSFLTQKPALSQDENAHLEQYCAQFITLCEQFHQSYQQKQLTKLTTQELKEYLFQLGELEKIDTQLQILFLTVQTSKKTNKAYEKIKPIGDELYNQLHRQEQEILTGVGIFIVSGGLGGTGAVASMERMETEASFITSTIIGLGSLLMGGAFLISGKKYVGKSINELLPRTNYSCKRRYETIIMSDASILEKARRDKKTIYLASLNEGNLLRAYGFENDQWVIREIDTAETGCDADTRKNNSRKIAYIKSYFEKSTHIGIEAGAGLGEIISSFGFNPSLRDPSPRTTAERLQYIGKMIYSLEKESSLTTSVQHSASN